MPESLIVVLAAAAAQSGVVEAGILLATDTIALSLVGAATPIGIPSTVVPRRIECRS